MKDLMGPSSQQMKGDADEMDALAMMKIVNQVNEKHDQMMGVYQNRINSVNTIKHWWNKQNNANSAINSLNLQNDIGITMDVINATLA